MSTYIGITLGPINRIMSYTQSTRSLWGASYFFTFLAKAIIKPFISEGKGFVPSRPFLKPQLDSRMWTIRDGVGRFPDQYIFKAEAGDFEYLVQHINCVFQDLGSAVAEKIGKEKEQEIVCYLKNTIKIYVLEKQMEIEEKVIEEFQQAFACMECQDRYPAKERENYLYQFFDKVKDSRLTRDAFETDPTREEGDEEDASQTFSAEISRKGMRKKKGNRMFDTIIECAAREAVEKKLIAKHQLFKDEEVEKLPSFYKYIAFVAADGDHVGKALRTLGQKMSNILLEYNTSVKQIVDQYGGQVIYQGGDDLLFFAPIRQIFTLIKEIDDCFYQKVQSDEEVKKLPDKPSLSFGVAMAYYKHPMGETVTLANSLLEKAKETGRNRIVWNVRKHSGQSFFATFNKTHPEIYALLLAIIRKGEEEEDLFLHSLIHYLLRHKLILVHILSRQESREARLENYMKSSFEDACHVQHQPFLESLRAYLVAASGVEEAPFEEVIERLHALLRFVELIIKKAK